MVNQRRILVFADSLAFHGPHRVEPPDTPHLFPNVAARALGSDVGVDLVARLGYTARDGWWALTKDPVVWGTYLPRASGVVLALGQYDSLPAGIPTWIRTLIPYIRPGAARRLVRTAHLRSEPHLIRATGGRMQQLPNSVSNHYLTRITEGIRYMRPDLPIARLLAAPRDSALYPSQRPMLPAVEAGRSWCERNGVEPVELGQLVRIEDLNDDGLHWNWPNHARVGAATASALQAAGFPRATVDATALA